jgi:acyl-CoA synthetase (AMP-forming)/AMP-acid ligase II/acyl carrier protein
MSGGEGLSSGLCHRFRQIMPRSILLNQYGSTEDSATVTSYDTKLLAGQPASVPIGQPIHNTQLYILDEALQPVPIGVPGELCVGGAGLARGYLRDPQLTAEKFVPNPFAQKPGCRIFRTGDLARYLPDGNVEHLGRIGHQVKIRGIRIELGEIEAVLEQHPAVKRAVVLVKEYGSDRRLAAYLVVDDGPAATIGGIRSFLRNRLPEYMVPAAYVMLEALPLTPSGKVDRRSLPEPDWSRRDLEQPFVAPRTPVEQALADACSRVLGVERVGIHDDFFDLGGHSLLVAELVLHIRKDLGVALSLQSLFSTPTVAGLSGVVEMARWSAGDRLYQPELVDHYDEEGVL